MFTSILRVAALLLIAACVAQPPVLPDLRPTNGTMSFKIHRADGTLGQQSSALVAVSKSGKKALVNGASGGDKVDGRKAFPAGTPVSEIVAHYDALLAMHGWVAGNDYKAIDNSLHFYGIRDLGGGSDHPHLGVYGATDSVDMPYRDEAPKPR